jgi:glucokinase
MTAIDSQSEYAIGIDIGGTKTLVALVDGSGGIVRSIRFPTLPEHGVGDVIERITGAAVELKDEAAARGGTVLGIGVASAGVLDARQQRIVYAANLNWQNVPVGRLLSERTGLAVKLGNDANLAAVAEYVWGSRRSARDLIYVTVSTGVGAGMISGGQLVEGASDSAGEFGHMTADPFGPRCSCGNYGCLENYSSGTALAATANSRLGQREGDDSRWTARDLMEAAGAGHAGAMDIVRRAAFHLGNGLTSLIHLFNPQRIVLGGGVMAGELLLRETIRVVDARTIPSMRAQVAIERTTLGEEIGVLGAAGLFYMEGGMRA